MVTKRKTKIVARKDLATPKPLFVSQENVEQYCSGKIRDVVRDKKGRFAKKRTHTTLADLDDISIVKITKESFNMNKAVETSLNEMNIGDSIDRIDRAVRRDKIEKKHCLGPYREKEAIVVQENKSLVDRFKKLISKIGELF